MLISLHSAVIHNSKSQSTTALDLHHQTVPVVRYLMLTQPRGAGEEDKIEDQAVPGRAIYCGTLGSPHYSLQ